MSETSKNVEPRREFIKNTARIAAASALAGVAIPHVHAAEDNTIRLALIGCGGRGSGAVANAMSAGGLVDGQRLTAPKARRTRRPAGRSSWSPWPICSRTGWTSRTPP